MSDQEAQSAKTPAWGSAAWVVSRDQSEVEPSEAFDSPEAGWYADPTYRDQERRWDGNAWTTERRLNSTRRSPSALQVWEDQIRDKIETNGYLRVAGAGMWWLIKGIAFVIYCLVLFVVAYWFIST